MLKKFLLKYRTKKHLKKPHNGRVAVSFEQAKTIGIIIDKIKHNEITEINDFINELIDTGKKISVLTYDNRKENPQLDIPYEIITRKDISWNGKFKDAEIKKFINTDFDYLLSIGTSTPLPLQNIIAGSKAKCRIGLYDESKNGSLELMIKPENHLSLQKKLEQMYIYTKMINN